LSDEALLDRVSETVNFAESDEDAISHRLVRGIRRFGSIDEDLIRRPSRTTTRAQP
jgi:hypothetical protein